jgi:hypothetical protein
MYLDIFSSQDCLYTLSQKNHLDAQSHKIQSRQVGDEVTSKVLHFGRVSHFSATLSICKVVLRAISILSNRESDKSY